jgi:hypothetical protein
MTLVAMPIASAAASTQGTGRELVGVLRNTVDVADQRADRRGDPARDEHAEHQAAERSDQTGHRALAEEQPANLRPRRAQCPQDADLGSAFRHGDGKRVVDDEHPDEEGEQAGDIHHHRVRRQHRLELLPAAGRRLDLKAWTEERSQLRSV